MASESWSAWWRERGRRELTLILWVWDPIGDVPIDEYEIHALPIAHLLEAGEPAEEIVGKLDEIRRKLELDADPQRDLGVARKLQEWYRWSFVRGA